MKKVILIILLSAVPLFVNAQIGGEDEVYLSKDVINSRFNESGLNKFYKFVNQNFDFSKVSQKGRKITSFTIN